MPFHRILHSQWQSNFSEGNNSDTHGYSFRALFAIKYALKKG